MDILPVSDGTTFPARKILALGRNYVAHAEEMNSEVPKEPVVFIKPNTTLLTSDVLEIPTDIGRIDHEVELAIHIGKGGKNIPASSAMDHVFGYSVALDITARDVQANAKKKGLPWSIAKGIDGFCPISTIVPKEGIDPHDLDISLTVNGEVKQSSTTSLMIFDIPTTIAFLSRWMTLEEGDIILTGTPAGVSPITPGNELEGTISQVGKVKVKVSAQVSDNN